MVHDYSVMTFCGVMILILKLFIIQKRAICAIVYENVIYVHNNIHLYKNSDIHNDNTGNEDSLYLTLRL